MSFRQDCEPIYDMAMEAIRLDISRWPVVVVTPSESFTDADIDAFLAQYEKVLNARMEAYVTVLDLQRCKDMSPTQRKRITRGMDKNREHRRLWQRGIAMVFDSAILRMILTAILWANKPEYEIKVFSDLQEALKWASTRVEARASVPPSRAANM